jgi:glycosyltransferase involved in cell wall biosynthesis
VSQTPAGVSFVVPVRNGGGWLEPALRAILREADGRPVEVLAVDDGSTDGSRVILDRYAALGRVRVLEGPGGGAAAAINLGIRAARHPIVCQIDQDVILEPAWLDRVTAALAAPGVAAAQGYYATPARATLWARVMGLDLEARYARIRGHDVDHVCTGNSAYRAEALREVGLLDEGLGYGYDNDLSYRLGAAGYRLRFCREARSVHRWRESLAGYLRQQYGVGYGRLDLVSKHPRRLAGDDVSRLGMILHAPAMLAALLALTLAIPLAAAGGPWRPFALGGAAVLGALGLERLVAGLAAAIRFRDPAGLWFAPVHLGRDVAWAWALIVWTWRRLRGRSSRPSDSMAS